MFQRVVLQKVFPVFAFIFGLLFVLVPSVNAGNFSVNLTTAVGGAPTTIAPGGSLELRWQVWWVGAAALPAFPIECSSSHWPGFSVSDNADDFVQGTVVVSPDSTTEYSLSCRENGSAETAIARLVVSVSDTPTLSLWSFPTSLPAGGGPLVLSWSVGAATSCTPSGGTPEWRAVTGAHTGGSLPFSISSTTTFTLTCSNSAKSVTQSLVIPVGSGGGFACTGTPPWLISPYTEIYGPEESTDMTESVDWSYAPTNTSRKCEFHCKSGSNWVMSKSGMTCSPPGGTDPPSEINLLVDKPTVRIGESITLTWSAAGVPDGGACSKTSSTNDPGWTGSLDKIQLESGGNQSLLPSDSAGKNKAGRYTYLLCTSPVYVNVVDFPVINSFLADPATIDVGQSSTLRWNVSNADRGCNLSKGSEPAKTMADVLWSGDGETTTSFGVSPETSTYYTLECYNNSASDSKAHKTVLVRINGTPDPSPGSSSGSGSGSGSSGGPGGGGDGSCLSPNLCQAGSCGTDRHEVAGTCLSG